MARVLERWSKPLTAAVLLAACGALSACGPDAPGPEGANAIAPPAPTISGDPATPPTTGAEPPASLAVTFALPADDGSLQPATAASILTARAMYVVADWTGVTPEQAQQLELLAPGGTLPYLSATFALAAGDDLPASVVALADGTVRATYRIAIAGTRIAQYQRTGTWTASVGLVGGSASGIATIELTP